MNRSIAATLVLFASFGCRTDIRPIAVPSQPRDPSSIPSVKGIVRQQTPFNVYWTPPSECGAGDAEWECGRRDGVSRSATTTVCGYGMARDEKLAVITFVEVATHSGVDPTWYRDGSDAPIYEVTLDSEGERAVLVENAPPPFNGFRELCTPPLHFKRVESDAGVLYLPDGR